MSTVDENASVRPRRPAPVVTALLFSPTSGPHTEARGLREGFVPGWGKALREARACWKP